MASMNGYATMTSSLLSGGRVAAKGGVDVGVQQVADVRQAAEKIKGRRVREFAEVLSWARRPAVRIPGSWRLRLRDVSRRSPSASRFRLSVRKTESSFSSKKPGNSRRKRSTVMKPMRVLDGRFLPSK